MTIPKTTRQNSSTNPTVFIKPLTHSQTKQTNRIQQPIKESQNIKTSQKKKQFAKRALIRFGPRKLHVDPTRDDRARITRFDPRSPRTPTFGGCALCARRVHILIRDITPSRFVCVYRVRECRKSAGRWRWPHQHKRRRLSTLGLSRVEFCIMSQAVVQ